jgi:hypothetical protein
MDLFYVLSLCLARLGFRVVVDPNLPYYGEVKGNLVVVQENQDVETLAHEAVHVAQVLYQRHGIGPCLFTLNPLEVNPDLRGNLGDLQHIWDAVRSYPPELWGVEMAAYCLEKHPEKVLSLLRSLAQEAKDKNILL